MSLSDPTFIGQVASVTGGIVRVRLREDMPTTLVMIEGESYRVGQIGAFFRIALGYTQLYAVCTQVGADAAPSNSLEADSGSALETPTTERLAGYRWMAVTLFGESIGSQFERGVGQYPTVGDEVHIVTNEDLQVIYGCLEIREERCRLAQLQRRLGFPQISASRDLSVGIAPLLDRRELENRTL